MFILPALSAEEFSYTVPYPMSAQIGLSLNGDPAVLALNVGADKYIFEPLNLYGYLQAMGHRPLHKIFWGGGFGFQICKPGRFSPFLGGGIFLGQTDIDLEADDDLVDNNNNGVIDEPGEEEERGTHIASYYPEFGFHYWMTDMVRITTRAQYYVTDKGRDNNFWTFGFQLSRVIDW